MKDCRARRNRLRTVAAAVVVVVGLLSAVACGADSPGGSLVDVGAGLRGPSGVVASVYADGPAAVSAFAFDAAGRLWLATAAYDDEGADGVYLVASRAARPEQVVADLHTALGLLWVGETLLVAHAGGVEAYEGFDGTSFGSHRLLVAVDRAVGQPDGLALGPDGRVRLGISAPCDHCTPTSPLSGAVVSFQPDGADLQVEASGIRAPVGLAYRPGTGDLFVTMNQRDDLGDSTPGDWLSVVSSGQRWGFPDCYGQGGAACNGSPGPVAALDEHAAVSGVAFPTGQLATVLGDTAVVAEWAKGTVLRVDLPTTADGYQGRASTFLTGIGQPEPVAATPMGTLVVGDWATGRIYELRRGPGLRTPPTEPPPTEPPPTEPPPTEPQPASPSAG